MSEQLSTLSRRGFLRLVTGVALGFTASEVLRGSVALADSFESKRELELQQLEWYRKWIAEGRSVRLVDEQVALDELRGAQIVNLELTQGLTCIDGPIKYAQQTPNLIQNFQRDTLVECVWSAPMGDWTLTVSRYLNLVDLGSSFDDHKQKAVKSIDYPKLFEDWSDKSVVTFSKTIGDYTITWSISNKGGQSNPLLQGGKVERGDYSLLITSTKTGKVVAAVGFASRLIEPGLDVQHALKNTGLHSLKSYTDSETKITMKYFEFGSLHPPGSFPLENTYHSMSSLDEKQINVLITAILAFVSTAVFPQIAVTTV